MMKGKIMETLNPAEQASVDALEQLRKCINKNQCFRLEAGAGAGKTYSLIGTIKHLMSSRANALRRNNQRIACITYTNVAKDEIKEKTENNPIIHTDTIHAFCWGILQRYQAILRNHIPELGANWTKRINESVSITNQIVRYDLGFPSIKEYEITLHHDDVLILMSRMLYYSKFQKFIRSKFPIIFIDEYQDTDNKLAISLLINLINNNSGVMIGLFGDHWQKIYGSSANSVISRDYHGIVTISKQANFRSDRNIVECLNRMRPELTQAVSDLSSLGTIRVFHTNSWDGIRRGGSHWKGDLPETSAKKYIENIKILMAESGWDMSPQKKKVLFLTNNLIATEQNFKNISACFHSTEDYLKKNDKYVKFFIEVLEPIACAFKKNQYGKLFQIMNNMYFRLACHSDKITCRENLRKIIDKRINSTIGEMLDLLLETKTLKLPSKILEKERGYKQLYLKSPFQLTEDDKKFFKRHNRFRSISYKEVVNLAEFINEKTLSSTKHSVKGAEFDNVLVICSRGWSQYNWDQMLEWMADGCTEEEKNMFERNRNLFYVCCSRAKHNLTILFTQKLSDKSISTLKCIFGNENILDICVVGDVEKIYG